MMMNKFKTKDKEHLKEWKCRENTLVHIKKLSYKMANKMTNNIYINLKQNYI